MTHSAAPQHIVTRFAPSPTGRLHVGHGWSALMAMDLARSGGGVLRLRIEDIDGTRSRPEHVAGIIEDLRWLGVEWNGDIVFQSRRLARYDMALERLRKDGLLYPCFCTRADIQASLTAPHGPEGTVYPGTCRALDPADSEVRIMTGIPHAWRLDVMKAVVRADPLTWRALSFPPDMGDAGAAVMADPSPLGDVVLARKDAPASYHLSCTLDDAAMSVSHVLRGADLIEATHVHRLLQSLLALPSPAYLHHPLLVGPDGRRLAKRDGSIALADLRRDGIDPAQLAKDLRQGRFPVGIGFANA